MRKSLMLAIPLMLVLSVSLISAHTSNFCYTPNEVQERSCNISNGEGIQERTCNHQYYWWIWSSWSSCEVTSCNDGYEKQGNSCVLIKIEVPEQIVTIEQTPKIKHHGDGSCFVTWKGCENGVAVKNDYIPFPQWTDEERTARGYHIVKGKFCGANIWEKPDCSGSSVTVIIKEDKKEPVKEQVLIDDTLGNGEVRDIFGIITNWIKDKFGVI